MELKGQMFRLLAGALLIASTATGNNDQEVDYYRDEEAFRRGIKLFPFEVHDADYLQVRYDDSHIVQELRWYSRDDSLLKTRSYEYWSDDGSIKRTLEMTADSLILREVLFGPEPKSREFIEYVYGVEQVADFKNRFTEIHYDSTDAVVAYKIYSSQGQLLGGVFLDYDSLGYLTNETWFYCPDPSQPGGHMERVREFRYIFNRDTYEQEVIERGRDGQVVSHVRIRTRPHQVIGTDMGVEVIPGIEVDSLVPEPEAPPDSGGVEPEKE